MFQDPFGQLYFNQQNKLWNTAMVGVTYNNFECLRYNYLLCFNVYVTILFVLPPF